jgi:glyoxylase-like metal-dependent hydrolase (beta-lactamase superfamily II)
MGYTEKIVDKVYKIKADSNLYFLDFDEKMVIDTGSDSNKDIVKRELGKLVELKEIKKIIFTHLHYDHIGNYDLFPNAKFFASLSEIEDFKKDPVGTTVSEEKVDVDLKLLGKMMEFEIVDTPGHTRGSICLFFLKEKILFSGDTLFYKGFGRIDLPTSVPEEMKGSLDKLKKLEYKVLCPGHEY